MSIAVVFALSASPALGANTITVHVGGSSFSFTQADVTIAAGDSIHWIWDGTGHSVTSGAHPPTANTAFDSEVQAIGFTYDQTFSHPGVYHYFCKIHYGSGMVGTVTVTGGPDPPPSVSFTAPATGTAGQPVQFDASATSTADGDTLDSYSWDFGDGTQEVMFGPVVTHTFASVGSPTVKLTVDDSGSQSASVSHAITVAAPPNRPPIASFAVSLNAQTAAFDGSISSDPDGDAITAYQWDFGDGVQQTTTGATASHHYTRSGPATVKLIVVDSHGLASAPSTESLNVPAITPPPPSISKLHLSKTSFCTHKARRCRHPGTRISLTLSAAARIALVVTHGRHRVQHATLSGEAGRNTFSFPGAGLKPGTYALTLTPVGGRAARIAFSVVGR
jgi:trimeric autotransporter adhesin